MAFVFSLQRIIEILAADVEPVGDFSGDITGIASLSSARKGDLSFLGNHKYRNQVEDSEASVILLPKDYAGDPADGQTYLNVENPSFALAMICREIERVLMPAPAPGVHPSAVIHPEASVSPEATVGPLCVVEEGAIVEAAVLESQVHVGKHAKIAAGAHVFPGVVIGNYCEIGERNRIHAGCVIGSDGLATSLWRVLMSGCLKSAMLLPRRMSTSGPARQSIGLVLAVPISEKARRLIIKCRSPTTFVSGSTACWWLKLASAAAPKSATVW